MGEWLLGGPGKGLAGRIRKWLLIILGGLFVLVLGTVYFVNLPTMKPGLAVGLPILAIFLIVTGLVACFAIRSKAGKTDRH